jgi:hypothetical protein
MAIAAMPVTPADRIDWMTGRTFAAKRSAWTLRPRAAASGALRGLPSLDGHWEVLANRKPIPPPQIPAGLRAKQVESSKSCRICFLNDDMYVGQIEWSTSHLTV